ncbi:MAG: hypothetical protein Q9227_003859 [Pyrenula ochraceoflavens]
MPSIVNKLKDKIEDKLHHNDKDKSSSDSNASHQKSSRYPSDALDPAPLAKPLEFPFTHKSAPNRFLKAAMTERLSTWHPTDLDARGIPTPELIRAYQRWGEGALGLILTGNTMIFPDQLEAPGNPIIPSDAPFEGKRFDAFKELCAQSKKHGSLCVGQISHPGRQTADFLQPDPVSASDIKLDQRMGMEFAKPHPASKQEIETIKAAFVHSAEYLYAAGYDGIELHGAHGYLLAQFLSKSTNKRTDEYGGDLNNRARIILEIGRAIREKLPAEQTKFVLGIKLNSVEFQEDGFSAEECRDLCQSLEAEGFDFVELSGGTYQELAFSHRRESTKKREAFFLEFADTITPALKKTKVYVTGGFRTVGAMVKAMDSIDGVGLARPVCQEFDIAKNILNKKITGAIDQKVDQDNFALTNMIAGTQIKQVGNDKKPIDMSDEGNVDKFNKDMEKFTTKMGEDKEGWTYGYVEDVDMTPSAYGPTV